MVGVNAPTWLSLLLSFFIIFHKAHCLCTNRENSEPFRFESYFGSDRQYSIILLEKYQLQISCCVVSTSPSVSWLFNGKEINDYGDLFVLSEYGQVLQGSKEAIVNNKVLEGVYNCTALEGNETLSAAFIITHIPTRGSCSQAKTTDVKLGHPPSSLYRIVPNHSVTLECTVLLTCHVYDGFEEVYWEKYYMKSPDNTTKQTTDDFGEDPNRKRAYMLFVNDPYDSQTGNYVNVTTRALSKNQVLVTTILYITNVTDNDLHDPDNPDGYEYLSCDNDDAACRTNRTKNYYKCGYIGSGTVNPLQNALATSRTVRMFSSDPPMLLSQITIQPGTLDSELVISYNNKTSPLKLPPDFGHRIIFYSASSATNVPQLVMCMLALLAVAAPTMEAR